MGFHCFKTLNFILNYTPACLSTNFLSLDPLHDGQAIVLFTIHSFNIPPSVVLTHSKWAPINPHSLKQQCSSIFHVWISLLGRNPSDASLKFVYGAIKLVLHGCLELCSPATAVFLIHALKETFALTDKTGSYFGVGTRRVSCDYDIHVTKLYIGSWQRLEIATTKLSTGQWSQFLSK